MKVVLKRVVAYMIDIIIVSLVVTFITSNSHINKDYDKYNDTYKEFQDNYEMHQDFLTDFEEFYKDDEIKEEEYDELIENYPLYEQYLEEIKTSIDFDYDDIIKKVNDYYSNQELDYSYNLVKLSVIQTIISILCILMYFVIIQYYFNGQTLGKKIMKLQVVSIKDKPLTIVNYFIRSLIVNEVFINVMSIIFVIILNKENYVIYSQIVYIITYIVEIIIIFTIVFDKNHRGIHDYISNTKVVEIIK